jgi:hypothetical protein
MNEEAFDRGGRIPSFDGNIQNFPTLWKKFSAYATMARIKSTLKEERDVNLPEKEVSEIDEQDKKGKLAHLAVSKNALAMASFLIAFTTDKAMNILYRRLKSVVSSYSPEASKLIKNIEQGR